MKKSIAISILFFLPVLLFASTRVNINITDNGVILNDPFNCPYNSHPVYYLVTPYSYSAYNSSDCDTYNLIGQQLPTEPDGEYYIYFTGRSSYDSPATSTYDYNAKLISINGKWNNAYDNPIIDSFTYSTSTELARVTGHWNISTTTGVSTNIEFYETGYLGQEYYTNLIATSTGYFDFSFFASSVGLGTTTPYSLTATIYELDSRGITNIFNQGQGTRNILDTATIIGRASTTTASYRTLTEGLYCQILNFDLARCIGAMGSFLFTPTGTDIENIKSHLRNDIFLKWPIRYFGDIIDVFSTTTIGSLAIIDVTVPKSMIGAGSHLTLSFDHAIDGILNATSSIFSGSNENTDSTKTLFEITDYYWKTILYIGLAFYIISRLLGSHLIPSFGSTSTESVVQSIDSKGRYRMTKVKGVSRSIKQR